MREFQDLYLTHENAIPMSKLKQVLEAINEQNEIIKINKDNPVEAVKQIREATKPKK